MSELMLYIDEQQSYIIHTVLLFIRGKYQHIYLFIMSASILFKILLAMQMGDTNQHPLRKLRPEL